MKDDFEKFEEDIYELNKWSSTNQQPSHNKSTNQWQVPWLNKDEYDQRKYLPRWWCVGVLIVSLILPHKLNLMGVFLFIKINLWDD